MKGADPNTAVASARRTAAAFASVLERSKAETVPTPYALRYALGILGDLDEAVEEDARKKRGRERYYTTSDAALMIGCSEAWVRHLAAKYSIGVKRVTSGAGSRTYNQKDINSLRNIAHACADPKTIQNYEDKKRLVQGKPEPIAEIA